MDRRDYHLETGEGSSLIIGVLVMIVVSSFVGMFIIVGSPLSPSSALAPQAQIQPIPGGVEVTASQVEGESHLLILCGNSSFTLSEGESGILYEPSCGSLTVNAVSDGTRSVVRSYALPPRPQTSALVVASDGSGNAQTLSEALDIATEGDTIVLRNTGRETQYNGSHTIETPVTIRSDTGVTAVTTSTAPLRVNAAGTTLEHVHLEGDTQTADDAVVQVTERAQLIDMNIDVTGPGTGLAITNAQGRNQLSAVTVSGTGTGIAIDNSTVEAINVHTLSGLARGIIVRLGPTVGHVSVEESDIAGGTGFHVSSAAGTSMTVDIDETRLYGRDVAIDLSTLNDATIMVTQSSIEGPETGVSLGTEDTPIRGTIIISQSAMAAELTTAVEWARLGPSSTVDLTENWWGRETGPPEPLRDADHETIKIRPWCTDTQCATLS
jgi:hypothetical protein